MIDFNAPSIIPSLAYLDLTHPGSISYFPGHGPSASQSDSSTTTSLTTTSSSTSSSQTTQSSSSSSTNTKSPASNTATTSTLTSTARPTDPASTTASSPISTSPQPLSTPAKIGLGVGLGIGALILAALAYLFLFFRKRHNKSRPPPPIEEQIRPKSYGSYAGITEPPPKSTGSPETETETETRDVALRSPAWSGHKSELPADESAMVSPMIPSTNSMAPNLVAEVEGTTPRQSVLSQQQQQQPMRQSRVSSQQPTFDANGIMQYVPYSQAAGRSMQSIHEMAG